jgi:hypothetical protein
MIDLLQRRSTPISAQPTPDLTSSTALATLSLMLCGAPAISKKHSAPQSPADLPATTACATPLPFEDGWRLMLAVIR